MAASDSDFVEQIFRRINDSVAESYRYNKPNLVWVGLIASIGFPLYYVVWELWFPQPYESLAMRLLGTALFLPFIFVQLLPKPVAKILPWYWLLAVFYGMPFFFVYMWLMNSGSSVWGMSTVCAIFLMEMLVYDWLLISVMGIGGFSLAWVMYGVVTGVWVLPEGSEAQLPIFAFAYVAGTVFSYKKEVVAQEKLDGMFMVTTNIANELKSPFARVSLSLRRLSKNFPKLIRGYELARKGGANVPAISDHEVNELSASLMFLDSEIDYCRVIVEMMWLSAGQVEFDSVATGKVKINQCISEAIHRYPYRSEEERRAVHFQSQQDFVVEGAEKLITHVIFQLIKNALQSIKAAGKGTVLIWCEAHEHNMRVYVRDTGTGISRDTLMRVFDRFFTTLPNGEGAGVGLYFCKQVLENLGGSIEIESELGQFTEVLLAFPISRAPQ